MITGKLIKFGEEQRAAMLRGIELLSKAVTTTLGPKGRNVTLGKKWKTPQILHDGVSVAKEIELEDPFENTGAQLVKEAASKTNDKAGDGTTTATLIACSMVQQGMRMINDGTNPMILKKGIEAMVTKVVQELKELSQPVDTPEKIAQVATVSCADPVLGEMIAEAVNKVGKDGTVSVDEGGLTTTIEYKEGMEFDKGYVSPFFATDSDRGEAEIVQPFILVTDQKIVSGQEIFKVGEMIRGAGITDLVIIADNVESDALATLFINKQRGAINPLAIFAPAIGDRRKDVLGDIAALTGANFITRDLGKTVENVTLEDLGRADKVWADEGRTKIIGGKGSKEQVEKRIAQIKAELAKSESEFDKEKIRERLARLTSGAAVIKIGALTEPELEDKKQRAIDAVEAVKSAIEEGVIPGGGVALYNIARTKDAGDDMGAYIVLEAIKAPLRKILLNAGVNADEVMKTIRLNLDKDPAYGFNVETEEFGNMIKMGITDPTKVTRSALENASSIAAMILTSESMIVDKPEEPKHE